ncbi:DUF6348 family protein [Flavobacterium sp.]|uniref:DUF6348 family protein n=1 Tax=Flavobacterium sp. TaxID=239 RepID=UPI004047309F
MRNITLTTIILISLTLFGCGTSTSDSAKDKSHNELIIESVNSEKISAKYLYDKIANKNKTILQDNEILIDDTSIKIKVTVDFDGKKEGKYIYSANFLTIYKTGHVNEINVGSIGIGTSKDEAVEVSIHEWFAVFGIPFTNMLRDTNSISLSNMKIFSGLMGIRGTLPENTWMDGSDEMNKKIISQIKNQINFSKATLIPIDIKLMVGPNGVTDGECRLGNEVSIELLDALKKIDWPKQSDSFMFKQFYLVKQDNKASH